MAERRRVTLVTGGGRGIGAATALRLARDGHHLGVGYTRSPGPAEEVAGAARALGVRAVPVRLDVSVQEEVDAAFDLVRDELGPVTGLVNSAGVTGPLGGFTDTSPEVIRRVVDVNVTGALLCARRALREMSTAHGGAGGSIVAIGSNAATTGSPGEYVHYAASKAAVDTMVMGLAKEFGAEGVRVNCVAPGAVLTDIHAEMGDPDRAWKKAESIPVRRPGEPEEIADAVGWLMSDEASFTTGAVLRVAGGV
ncbi:SDR family oxidoreductase [Streptomyces sp. ODS28]|uniref:SDR family NAD(P)-dependent oxidoreductase n=1 Tax=Streptomyces sp. ODS28 TaxID=3136688 RepID=UPI0031EECE53